MPNFLSGLFGRSEGTGEPPEIRYVQHPKTVSLDEGFVVPGEGEPQVLNGVAAFIWKRIATPQSASDLVSAVLDEFETDRVAATADVQQFMRELVQNGLALELPPGETLPLAPEGHDEAASLLAEAHKLQKAGDWPAAIALCIEAQKNPKWAGVAQLNILIGRYHLGRLDGVARQAHALAQALPAAAMIAGYGLTLVAAHRVGDLALARSVALGLARHVAEPWDLPTVPSFVVPVGGRVCVIENAQAKTMHTIVLELQTGADDEAERALLGDLAQRYVQRTTDTAG